jgi:hypothetical protein
MELEGSLPCSQDSSPIPRPYVTFRNKIFFTVNSFSPSPNLQARVPPLVGCPRLLESYGQLFTYIGTFWSKMEGKNI